MELAELGSEAEGLAILTSEREEFIRCLSVRATSHHISIPYSRCELFFRQIPTAAAENAILIELNYQVCLPPIPLTGILGVKKSTKGTTIHVKIAAGKAGLGTVLNYMLIT